MTDPATPLRVLMVDDREEDARLVARELKDGGFDLSLQRVCSAEEMRKALEARNWDLVTADSNMPGFDCFEAIEILRKSWQPDIPCIVLSSSMKEETAAAAMKAGAHDYLMKQNLKRLVPAVRRELEEARMRSAKREAEEKLQHQAYHDPLTGLPNMLLFKDRLGQALALARRYGRSVSVVAIDLDNFKEPNNVFGWSAGDELLRLVARKLKENVREEDTLARLWEDEFLLFSLGLSQPQDALQVIYRLDRIFESPFVVNGHEVQLKATYGISFYPNDGNDPDSLIGHAEMALQRAKETSKGSHQFYSSDINIRSFEHYKMQNELQKAFANKEFRVFYQPQVDVKTAVVSGCEALLRWAHPGRGTLAAADFIAHLEQSGLIIPVGEWVLRTVCSALKKWSDHGTPGFVCAVNLSALQFQNPEFVHVLEKILAETEVDPRALELEITESMAMQNLDHARKALDAFKKMGLRISIDDFGTGYSSLAYLKEFPVDQIKIDRSFVTGLPHGSKDVGIVSAIISLAHGLGLEVIAEGVEKKEQLECLRSLRCDKVQGYLYGMAVPEDAFIPMLQKSYAKASAPRKLG